ncbi:MAG: ribonuclease III [Alphaproteobacteria bacterium]|nr:ribonuclease III [Alphaproteobacteria bacterium]
MKPLDALQATLGHRFDDPARLTEALTHASADAKRSNERLEFLGDRVLGLVVAEELIRRFPGLEEGELAVRLNALVRKETCARVAQDTGIDTHIILAPGERQTGGVAKKAVLGDACEAIIAALYLDGGLPAARHFILTAWKNDFDASAGVGRDPKTELQEWAQSRSDLGRALPVYRVTHSSGPAHAPHFVVAVSVGTAGTAEGEGGSKREAERNAAAALLATLKGPA